MTTTTELETKLRALLARDATLRFAILFGSSVLRGPDAARDVDLAISTRAPMTLMQLAAFEDALEAALRKPVDVVDVEDANTLLRWEIVRRGRVVHVADLAALREFQARVPIEYADLRPYMDREAEGLRRALGAR